MNKNIVEYKVWKKQTRCIFPSEKHCKDVYKRYSENHRFYHSSNHPLQMLDYANNNNISLSNEQKLALLYHDVIYDTNSKTNEEDSAKYMFSSLSSHFSCDQLIIMCNIILDTQNHFQEVPLFRDEQSKIVCDLDIMNMSADYDDFLITNDQIIQEYNATKDQRKEFLKKFIQKPVLFFSKELYNQQAMARKNIERYIENG